MIDNGFSIKETDKRLERLGVNGQEISAILVTHEHSDHATGVARFARRYDIPVWASHGTSAMLKDVDTVKKFDSNKKLTLNEIDVVPVPVPHDAREPTQFVFKAADLKFGIMTDTGSITPHMVAALTDCD